MPATYIMGDVHGYYDVLLKLLRDANLIDAEKAWCGGDATLWFIGDFCDRGPDGIGVINLVMRLQQEALYSGGMVGAVLGNHDALLVAAYRFQNRALGAFFIGTWEMNGGRKTDLDGLTETHVEWLGNLPAMAEEGDVLLLHADAPFYTKYGTTINEVNAAFRLIVNDDDPPFWDKLLNDFSEHKGFSLMDTESIERFLKTYGKKRMIHGHTPIGHMNQVDYASVKQAHVYDNKLCVNVDGGIYLGGPGFLYKLPTP
jgi:Calcineurin-like phosphoesterase